MKVLGCNVTSKAIYFVEVSILAGKYEVSRPTKLATPTPEARALSRSLETVKAILAPEPGEKAFSIIAFSGCTSGSRGSSVSAIKAETLIQLAADSLGIKVQVFMPQAFFRLFKDAKGKTWSERARSVIDPNGQILYWTSGVDGAVCAAIKATESTGSA